MRFDLQDLRLFVHTLESGTITQGAERCHITLASASERIRGMEAVLGAPLLTRSKKGVTATEAGAVLLPHARRMLLQMEQMAGDMQAFGQGLGTRIELLANTSAISEHLIAPLGTFMQANPQLRLELRECTSDAIARALMAGEADMGVLSNAVPAGSLHTQVWRDDPLVLLGPARLLASLPEDVQLNHLKDIALLGLLPQHALHQLMAAQALQAGVALRYRALAPHLEALCDWVVMGLGAAVVPRTAAECATLRWPQARLRLRLLSADWAARQLVLACRDPAELPPQALQLWAFLQEAAH
ncbi:LysR family transcriptional regulator [Comamonas piscis]|uniref:LysR family transcriptional regulator n=1 Tax=Comamonas piscis TaxID=1562974 RepID=A0A7G5EGC3_9BURK|nr:LysR substrate-binding domain-containing protein [Comamonas piscis]QMV73048.1 LysR family transcriptional regulator [Comamonas piscis]WSO35831.1 LysR substrate-binding domain-containing protein [Comamonas piscis]